MFSPSVDEGGRAWRSACRVLVVAGGVHRPPRASNEPLVGETGDYAMRTLTAVGNTIDDTPALLGRKAVAAG